MKGLPSFSGFLAEILIQNCHYLIPGIERCDGIYFHPLHQKLHLTTARKNDEDISLETGDIETSEQIELLRRSKSGTAWLGLEEVPHLSLNQKKMTGSSLESELEKVVLLVKIPNQDDLLMDLIFLYNLSTLSLFGLSTNENLSASHKDITARLIFNSFKMLNINYKNINKSRKILNEALTENSRKLTELRNYNLEIQTEIQDRVVDYCRYQLENVSIKYNKRFYFADCALEQIRCFNGKLQLLDEVIAKAVAMANEIDILSKDIKIIESYLNFSISLPEHDQDNKIAGGVFIKEIEYLDKLELAAIKTLQEGKKLIGSNIIQNYDKVISFAAISGFINKHNVNIIRLLKTYPLKWPTLRNEFMPIKKFLEHIKPIDVPVSEDNGLFDKTG